MIVEDLALLSFSYCIRMKLHDRRSHHASTVLPLWVSRLFKVVSRSGEHTLVVAAEWWERFQILLVECNVCSSCAAKSFCHNVLYWSANHAAWACGCCRLDARPVLLRLLNSQVTTIFVGPMLWISYHHTLLQCHMTVMHHSLITKVLCIIKP